MRRKQGEGLRGAIRDLFVDGVWRTLGDIEAATGCPQATASAHLRDLRKRECGYCVVEKQLRDERWFYRVLPPGGAHEGGAMAKGRAVTVQTVPLAKVRGTQVMLPTNPEILSRLVEELEWKTQPPLRTYYDGETYWLWAGWEQFQAAQQGGVREMLVEAQPGREKDALWAGLMDIALSANGPDLSHAILVALGTWPDLSVRQIADHLKCRTKFIVELKEKVESRHHDLVGVTAKRGPLDRRPSARAKRIETLRTLAAKGVSVQGLAEATGMAVEGVRKACRDAKIAIPADDVMRRQRPFKADNIVQRIVEVAEPLCEGTKLVDLSTVTVSHIAEWVPGLKRGRLALSHLIVELERLQRKGDV